MRKRVWMLIAVLLLTACAAEEPTDDIYEESEAVYRKITAEEAKAMMDEGKGRIIDVREPGEYADGHVPGAELLPVGDIKAGELSTLPDKDEVLLVYCRSGNRSGQAARQLVEYGYTQVYDFGGIIDWPYDIEK